MLTQWPVPAALTAQYLHSQIFEQWRGVLVASLSIRIANRFSRVRLRRRVPPPQANPYYMNDRRGEMLTDYNAVNVSNREKKGIPIRGLSLACFCKCIECYKQDLRTAKGCYPFKVFHSPALQVVYYCPSIWQPACRRIVNFRRGQF